MSHHHPVTRYVVVENISYFKVWGGSVNFALRTHASAVAPPLTRLARPCRPHSTDMIHVIGPVMHPSYK